MESVAIIGDIHLAPKIENSTILRNVVAGQRKFLDSLPAQFSERGIKSVVFTGDVFSHRSYLNIDALDYALEYFGITLKDFDVHIVAGNHDMLHENTNSVTSIRALSLFPNVHVYSSSIGKAKLDGRTWYFVPWVTPDMYGKTGEWLEKLSAKGGKESRVIVGHFDMYGVLMEAGQYSDSGFDVGKFYGAARHTFSGHYHCRSAMTGNGSTIHYVGSPYHLSFAHVGTDCGYSIVTGDDVEFVENTECPRFVDLKDTEVEPGMDFSNRFVRFFVDNACPFDQSALIKDTLMEASPLFVKQIPYGGKDGTVEEQKVVDDEETKRLLSSDALGMAELYLDKFPEKLPVLSTGEDPKARIMKLFREYTARNL